MKTLFFECASYANEKILLKKAPRAYKFYYYNTNVDGVSAVRSNKIDCYVDDEPVLAGFEKQNIANFTKHCKLLE